MDRIEQHKTDQSPEEPAKKPSININSSTNWSQFI